MSGHTEYLMFHTRKHREYIHITPQIEAIVKKSAIKEGMVLISAMHITAGVFHHEVIVPITAGRLDLGPWQRIFYAEFDGQRDKRVIVKVMGE